jgi:UDP-glucose 4-epimerase
MKLVLITGVAGNIGSALAHALLKNGNYKIVGVDNLSTGARHKLPSPSDKFSFIKSDVNDYREISAIFHSNHFDYVFHFAAVVGVQRTLANPLLVLNDINGIKNILSLSKNSFVTKVFYSSSSEVYGEPVSLPQHEETTPLNSRLPYAIVKNLGEAYFRSYYEEHGLPYTVFRFFNTYGPNQSDDFVVPRFIHTALKNDQISIYGDGSQTRTFCYVDDNIEAIVRCLDQGCYVNDVVNIGSDIEYKIVDLANLILQISGSKSTIVHFPPLPEGDMTRRQPDISKMKVLLNRNLTPLNKGIKLLIDHYTSKV